MHVCALFSRRIRAYKLLKTRELRRRDWARFNLSLVRDEAQSRAPSLATKYGICFQRVTVRCNENHLIETLSQFDTVSPHLDSQKPSQILGLGGGRSRAWTGSVKPTRLCEPSQKGLLAECPHRQRPMAVRPAKPKGAPVGSRISKSPSTRMGPLLLTVIFVAAMIRLFSYQIYVHGF